MPYRASELIKRQIVQIDSGNIIGHVEDLVIDPEQQCVVGLVTTTPRWLREAEVLPWKQVRVATGDVILVEAGAMPCAVSALPEIQAIMERRIHLNGTAVMSTAGSRYGAIQDVLVDVDGALAGYVVGAGFLGTDRHFLPASAVSAIGADAMIALDGSLEDLPQPAGALPAGQVILPFTGTRILVEETETVVDEDVPRLPEPLPASESAAVLLGEHWYDSGPVTAPPVTDEASAAETQVGLTDPGLQSAPILETPPVTDQESAAEMLLDTVGASAAVAPEFDADMFAAPDDPVAETLGLPFAPEMADAVEPVAAAPDAAELLATPEAGAAAVVDEAGWDTDHPEQAAPEAGAATAVDELGWGADYAEQAAPEDGSAAEVVEAGWGADHAEQAPPEAAALAAPEDDAAAAVDDSGWDTDHTGN